MINILWIAVATIVWLILFTIFTKTMEVTAILINRADNSDRGFHTIGFIVELLGIILITIAYFKLLFHLINNIQ